MKILKNITIKQVLTEKSKEKLRTAFLDEKQQLHKECEQFRFEIKKYEKHIRREYNYSEKMEKEIKVRQEKLKMIDFQLEQLDILPIGSELKESEVQALINVTVGDKWDGLNKTIVIKDGFVHEIRDR